MKWGQTQNFSHIPTFFEKHNNQKPTKNAIQKQFHITDTTKLQPWQFLNLNPQKSHKNQKSTKKKQKKRDKINCIYIVKHATN